MEIAICYRFILNYIAIKKNAYRYRWFDMCNSKKQ